MVRMGLVLLSLTVVSCKDTFDTMIIMKGVYHVTVIDVLD